MNSIVTLKLAYLCIFVFSTSCIIFFRNNLTAVEAVELEGTGSHGQLAFGSLGANTDSYILHFKLTEKHLQNCDTGKGHLTT